MLILTSQWLKWPGQAGVENLTHFMHKIIQKEHFFINNRGLKPEQGAAAPPGPLTLTADHAALYL